MHQPSVCIVTPSYPTEAEPYSAFFIRDQAGALRNAGCKVSVVAPRIFGRGSMVNVVDSIPVYNFSFLTKSRRLSEFKRIPIIVMVSYVASGIKKLFQVVRRERCNIIHAHWVVPSGFIAVIVGKFFLGKPVVVTAHGSDITVFPRKGGIARRLVEFVLKRADRIIAVSYLIEDTIASEFKIPRSKISMIRLGVDLDLFRPGDQKEARVKLGLPLDKKITLFVGDLVEVKGINYLIAAVPEVIRKNSNALVILIGEGSQREHLEKQAQELKVERYVKFLGPKPHDEIPFWMNAADIFVLPSLSEGAPVSLMETAAIGLPVVATDVGSVSELVEDGVNGFIVRSRDPHALADKINLLLQDRDLDLSLRHPLIKRLAEFDMTKAAVGMKTVYDELVDKGEREHE